MPRAEAFRQAGGGGGAGLALVVLLVVAGLASYVGLLLVRPLRRLSSVAAKVAAGDHSVELPTGGGGEVGQLTQVFKNLVTRVREREGQGERSEEHTSELQSLAYLVCRLLLEKKKKNITKIKVLSHITTESSY